MPKTFTYIFSQNVLIDLDDFVLFLLLLLLLLLLFGGGGGGILPWPVGAFKTLAEV